MASKSNLSGTKFLITAAAISGTLGGWILLSLTGSGSNTGNGAIQDPAILDLLNQPLPTLAQPNGSFFEPVVNPNTSAANPPASQQALRKVVAPAQAPGAVAITRSSRK